MFSCGAAWAGVPESLHFQGLLTNDQQAAIPDGSYSITFSLWDGADPATAQNLWQETQSVVVQGGAYGALLGSVVPFSDPDGNPATADGLSFAIPYYLGIEVGSDGLMLAGGQLPALASTASALRAKSSAGRLVRQIAASTTLGEQDDVVLASGTLTLTLPTAVGRAGRVYTVKNVATGVVTVAASAGQSVDGAAQASFNGGEGASLISDGTGWTSLARTPGLQGPAGTAGVLNLYGDGSAGAFFVPSGSTLDLTTQSGFNSLSGRHHMQFTSINIAGTLIVPSGTLLRATGDVTISGTVTVLPGTQDAANGQPQPGIALAAPGSSRNGGVGLSPLSAAQLTRPPAAAGGAGVRLSSTSGGDGGGSLAILARGNFYLYSSGSITANGLSGVNPGSVSDLAGGGGGAGGIIVIGAKGSMSVSGAIRANGGAGAPGVNGNGGAQGASGGGGGGGGIIHLISKASPSVTGTVQALGGAAGTGATATSNLPGAGGGACGGNGGTGGGVSSIDASTAGSSGYVLQTVVPEPENLFF